MRYDYKHQAWIDDEGKYVKCNHPESMNCTCYGKLHEGKVAEENKLSEIKPNNSK